TINKPLTLNGAQVGVDARTRSGAETILKLPVGSDGIAIMVTSDDVTISGFTIDGVDNPGSTGIRPWTGSGRNMTVSHNIITNTRNGFHANAAGVVLDGFTASYNFFD